MAVQDSHIYNELTEKCQPASDDWVMESFDQQENDSFRPALADMQKIGFFSLDRTTQTDASEIIDVKELTETVHNLLDDSATMRRDINFACSVMKADFEGKLQQKAIDLYVRVNEKVTDIEKMHEERVLTVRRAFKQQLADAISRMHSLYNKSFADKMINEKKRKTAEAGKWQAKYTDLQATIQRNEGVIAMLKAQLEENQARLEEEETIKSYGKSVTPNWAHEEELNELKDDVNRLESQVKSLEGAVESKHHTNMELNRVIDSVRDQLEMERIMVEQLKSELADASESNSKLYNELQHALQAAQNNQTHLQKELRHEKEQLQAEAEHSRASSQRMMESSQLDMQRQQEENLHKAREEALREAKLEMESIQKSDQEKIRRLMEEKKMIEELLAKEKGKQNTRSKEEEDIEQACRTEQKLRTEIAKLKKEIERIHRTWEKKFAILQQSLHALKDESFLRQSLQRQSAQLHQAAISFAYDQPMGIAPTARNQLGASPATNRKPLPDIKNQAKSPADFISYTVSAPSRGATTVYSIEENQVMSENEQDLPEDILPLPSPPQRGAADFGDESPSGSRPSTHSHVVVLPSVQAQ